MKIRTRVQICGALVNWKADQEYVVTPETKALAEGLIKLGRAVEVKPQAAAAKPPPPEPPEPPANETTTKGSPPKFKRGRPGK